MQRMWDLIVSGAEASGLSLAVQAKRGGVARVLLIGSKASRDVLVAAPRFEVDLMLNTTLVGVEDEGFGSVAVITTGDRLTARACALVCSTRGVGEPLIEIPSGLKQRVHLGEIDIPTRGLDVLVVGSGERVVSLTQNLVEQGARPVVCFQSKLEGLSWFSRDRLLSLERDRLATVLWDSAPGSLSELGGLPMAYFDDRRTPDLQFDHVVFAIPESETECAPDLISHACVYLVSETPRPGTVLTNDAWPLMRIEAFPELPEPSPLHSVTTLSVAEVEELREASYNATITHFDRAHNELWLIRVAPDNKDTSYLPGQYATLGLGYWEPRVDTADEALDDSKAKRMIRRSYSISSRILDARGYLADPGDDEEIEFYIVHVQPSDGKIPALTPRLAAKRVGDRVYIGPKIAGRYTLAAVDDPMLDVVFIATGTGEAPHNAMINQLLRRGHQGAMLSCVTVRSTKDLAYARTYERLTSRFPNVTYLPLVTREPGLPKRYVQDLIATGELAEMLPHGLDPVRTHVFLCGNPQMIGLPEGEPDALVFPEANGVCELLLERGFRLDRRGQSGNVHTEEYW